MAWAGALAVAIGIAGERAVAQESWPYASYVC